MVSLAEAQQELQMLQKQLGESEHRCCLGVLMSGGPLVVALHGFGLMVAKGKMKHGSQAVADGGKACLLLV
jgi:hypothetical protein